ncbi:lysylphosphatidylglycerol synthase transmembrane domain-containing protein [Oceanidesulfovibrio marinus]|uniref:Flippase-like domain-containing protein n=1 Tax=Oceanidesulfovibrio marinus TaxID=370038 RepID=A0ABX6NDX2_9BACT|nr:lysylphosphatidylglycerol synthase transmembrane domain-containing protein [Oceanidesulfovibrio marinus]QJT08364.1 flippase-like domain-containing protein [Oceanidesulfovibrio marinus]
MKIDKSNLRSTGKIFLMLSLLIWAAIWAWLNKDRLALAFQFNFGSFLFLVLLAITSFICIGYTNQIFFTYLGTPLQFKQWAALSFASSLTNLIFPLRAGAYFRARYLKKKFTLPYSMFLSTQAVFITMNILVNCLIGIASYAWLHHIEYNAPRSLVIAFAAVFVFCLGLLLFVPPAQNKHNNTGKIYTFILQIHDGWHQLRSSRSLMLKIILLTLILSSISITRLYIAFISVGHPMIPAGCALAASLAGIGTILSLTPSGLGIKEAVIVFIGVSLKIPAEIVVLAAVMDRAVGILVLVTLGSAGGLYIMHESTTSMHSTDGNSPS